MTLDDLRDALRARWPGSVHPVIDGERACCEIACDAAVLAELCGRLFLEWDYAFAGIVVEEGEHEWHLRYLFYDAAGEVHVMVRAPLAEATFPSLVRFVHAANWHEREAEDLFGLSFAGHPRLGDFVLHDDAWQEDIEPMRRSFSADTPVRDRAPNIEWRPPLIVEARGAFAMPIGPVYGGITESAHFLLETVGEDVIRAIPRLFFKYRGIEKIAEGRGVSDVLLLAERFAATTAFAHALAYCQAVERIGDVRVPPRAAVLRVFVAELERLRSHVGAIAGICESTALAIAASTAQMLEEDLLRVSGVLTGHRYLFGLCAPGGLTIDLSDAACRDALARVRAVAAELDRLDGMLRTTSSFLDRLEEVGYIAERDARAFGLVGPIARASGVGRDLRVTRPYAAYARSAFDVPVEYEGDGYARLRVLFAESRQSVRLMEQAASATPDGPIAVPVAPRAGAALGWVEAPRGASFHWVRLTDEGTIARYHLMPPSFANWLGFRLSVENFAFQDFPIVLSTLDLSAGENDR